MKSVFLTFATVAFALAVGAQQDSKTNALASVTVANATNLPPYSSLAPTNKSTELTYGYEALKAPRWTNHAPELPTFNNSGESATNAVRVLVRGNATKRRGYYLFSKGSRVLHAIEAAQVRVPFNLSESGLQRAETNGTWAFVRFQSTWQSEIPKWNEIPVWKLIPLENGDEIQITTLPVTSDYEILDNPRWGQPSKDLPTFGVSSTNSIRVAVYGWSGAVNNPGYYFIPEESCARDAINAAGMHKTGRGYSGLQRRRDDGKWLIFRFSNPKTWKLVPLEDGDQIYCWHEVF